VHEGSPELRIRCIIRLQSGDEDLRQTVAAYVDELLARAIQFLDFSEMSLDGFEINIRTDESRRTHSNREVG
jgi:hypothetical protein